MRALAPAVTALVLRRKGDIVFGKTLAIRLAPGPALGRLKRCKRAPALTMGEVTAGRSARANRVRDRRHGSAEAQRIPTDYSLAAARVQHARSLPAGYGNPHFPFAPGGLVAPNVPARQPAGANGPAEQSLSLRMLVRTGYRFQNQGGEG